MNDLTGQQLGKYRLLQSLGAGGFAQVYLGEHIHLNRWAAIKVLNAQVINQELLTRFFDEAKIIANLQHPNIVPVMEFAVEDYVPFLVMEYAQHGSLAQKITHGVPMPPAQIASYIKQMATALQFAHDHRITHLDVKPANMLLGQNNQLMLSDFGIAEVGRNTADPTVQQPRGTWVYAAPEQFDGHPVAASDQYALAIVAYELLTGDVPFHGTAFELQQLHRQMPPPSLYQKNPAISRQVEQVVQQALRKNPHSRYLSIQEFGNELERALTQHIPGPNLLVLPPLGTGGASPTAFTVPSSTVPLPSIPTQREEMPVHDLVLEQQRLVQHFVEVTAMQKEECERIEREGTDALQVAELQRDKDLAATDAEVEPFRHAVDTVSKYIKRHGWNRWCWFVSSFVHPTIALAQETTFSEYIAIYLPQKHKNYDHIARFLRHNPSPRNLFKRSELKGGICVVLAFVATVWIAITTVHNIQHIPIMAAIEVLLVLLGFVFLLAIGAFSLIPIVRMSNAFARLQQIAAYMEKEGEVERQRITASFYQQEAAIKRNFTSDLNQSTKKWNDQLSERQAEVDRFMQKLHYSGIDWDNPLWEQWRNSASSSSTTPNPPVARVGQLTVYPLPSLRPLPAIPSLLSCPNGDNLLLEVTGAPREAKDAAISVALSLMLRFLLTQAPGKVHFTLIDPARAGRTFEPFFWLRDHPDILMSGRALFIGQQIEQHLADLNEHIGRITYQPAGSLHEPYRVLMVMDFPDPEKFPQAAARHLLDIAQNGPHCRISTIMIVDQSRQFLSNNYSNIVDVSPLERLATVIRWNGQNFSVQDDQTHHCSLELDRLPEKSIYQPFIERFKQTYS